MSSPLCRLTARLWTVVAPAAFLALMPGASRGQMDAVSPQAQNPFPSVENLAPSGPYGGGSGQAYGAGATPTAPAAGAAAGATAPPTFGTGSSLLPGSGADSFTPGFGDQQSLAFGEGGTAIGDNVGYIDSAIIRSRFRMRFDTAYDFNSPDKAEFFYPKCGCFGNPRNFLVNGRIGPGYDPRATGPPVPNENRVDYQEVRPYLEAAFNQTTSVFIETPGRYVNPNKNANAWGWSDLNFGLKHALIANPDQFYTLQFRVYTPTGVGQRGLGTNHVTLEPGFLVFQRLTDRLYFSGEIRDWIPVHASNFAGNVLTYGAGLAYNIVLTDNLRVAPVNEFVGWSILSGRQSDPTAPGGSSSVADQTIVNYKIGLRFGLGDYRQAGGGSGLNDRHSLYMGYGRSITGDHWYKDMFRLEYDFWF